MIDYKKYYRDQAGSGVSAFHGTRYQRGSGLGNVLRKLYNWMLPVLKTHALPLITSGAKTFGKEALRSAANIASDSLSDFQFIDSFKSRSKEGINNIQKKIEDQIGNGIKRKKKKTVSHNSRKKQKKHSHDIFD
jgi:hypothetical protein